MTIEMFKTYLTAYGVPFQETRPGIVDIHDDDITAETASELRRLGLNSLNELVQFPREVHNVAANGLALIALACGCEITGWDKEHYVRELQE